MSGMASMQGGTVASTGLVNIQTLNPRPVIPRCRLPEDALLSSSRSSFISGAKLRTTRYVMYNLIFTHFCPLNLHGIIQSLS